MLPKKISFLIIAVSVIALSPSLVLAQYGLEETAGAAGLAKYGTDIPGMIGNILGTALSLVGVVFFGLMLFGGVMWMTSRGNTEQEKKALDTITAAIIGIIIVLGSYALTSFVFNNLVKGGGAPTPIETGEKNPPVVVKKACNCTYTSPPPESAGSTEKVDDVADQVACTAFNKLHKNGDDQLGVYSDCQLAK